MSKTYTSARFDTFILNKKCLLKTSVFVSAKIKKGKVELSIYEVAIHKDTPKIKGRSLTRIPWGRK